MMTSSSLSLARRTVAALALASCILGAQAASFHVAVDTSTLASPFTVDFQLIGGSPTGNTATVSNIQLGGGSVAGGATVSGLASGSLGSTVVLGSDNANFFNELLQGVSGGTKLSFDVMLSDHVNTPTPDGFSFAILDGSLANIPTTDTFGGSLLHIDIDGTPAGLHVYAGTGALAGVTVQAAAVPEPASMLSMALGVGVLAVAAARRRRNA